MADQDSSLRKAAILKQLRTDYLPTPVENECIQADVALLSTEPCHLRRTDESRSLSPAKQNSGIRRAKNALIFPTGRVPDDVVQDIFLGCLPAHRNSVMVVPSLALLRYRRAERHIDTLWDGLIQSATRWREMAFIDLPNGHFHKLQGLATPMLQSIDIRDDRDVTDSMPYHASSLHVISGDVALSLLYDLPQLISLNPALGEPDPNAYRNTRLPQRWTLSLKGVGFGLRVLDDLLEHLFMPRLLHLTIRAHERPHSKDPFYVILKERSPFITSLGVSSRNFTAGALRHTLSHLRSLTRMHVRMVDVWDVQLMLPFVELEDLFALLSEPIQTENAGNQTRSGDH
ncbi:hypothetical protein C8R43DRAFT_1104940 [Mycena crocata]|nr:hypothetical protein C8R43DRAFT_1104940 [Mycena crocata]